MAFVVDHDVEVRNKSHFTERKLADAGLAPIQTHYVGGPNELEELFTDERRAADTHERVVVTKNGRDHVLPIAAADLASIEATLDRSTRGS